VTRNAYRLLVGKYEGKRPLERPRRKWEDDTNSIITVVAVTKFYASRPLKDFTHTPSPYRMAWSHQYSVASFASLCVLNCLLSPGLRCSCCNVVRFCCDLETGNLVTATVTRLWQYGLDSAFLEQGLVWDHGNEHSVSTKCRELPNWLRGCQLLRKDSAPATDIRTFYVAIIQDRQRDWDRFSRRETETVA
jgi:hypothetical protein